MNKSELVSALAEQKNIKIADAEQVIEAMFDSIKEALVSGDRVEIRGFGSFAMKNYKGFKGRNPKTGKAVIVQPKKLPVFRLGQRLKDFINDKVTS